MGAYVDWIERESNSTLSEAFVGFFRLRVVGYAERRHENERAGLVEKEDGDQSTSFSTMSDIEDDDNAIKVIVRIRPFLPFETGNVSVVQAFENGKTIKINASQSSHAVGRTQFTFDQTYDIDSTQAQVFTKSVRPLVVSCMEGFNATTIKINASESPTLLQPNLNDAPKLSIRDGRTGVEPEVVNIKEVIVNSAEEALLCLLRGTLRLVKRATHINSESSRSHAIMSVCVQKTLAMLKDDGKIAKEITMKGSKFRRFCRFRTDQKDGDDVTGTQCLFLCSKRKE